MKNICVNVLARKKLFQNQWSLFIHKSRGLWSRHVLLKYINMIFDRSIRIIINPSQFTVPVSLFFFFFFNNPLLWPPAIPTLHGPVSLSVPDKFRGGHITKHETIRFPLKGSWNFELNQRLRGLYESLTNQQNKNYLGTLKQREFNAGKLLHLWRKSYEAKWGRVSECKKGVTTSLGWKNKGRERYYQSSREQSSQKFLSLWTYFSGKGYR